MSYKWLEDNPAFTKLVLEGAKSLNLNKSWFGYVTNQDHTKHNEDWARLQSVEDVMRFIQKELNIKGEVDDMITDYEIVIVAKPIKKES